MDRCLIRNSVQHTNRGYYSTSREASCLGTVSLCSRFFVIPDWLIVHPTHPIHLDRISIFAKLRFMELRQDSKGTGGVFVDFEDKDFDGSVSVKMPGKSVKAISVEAWSANKFVISDSIGNLHFLCLSYSLHGLDTGCVMRQSTQTMKVHKMAVFHDVSTVTQTVWISDGCYTVHMMAVSDVNASVDESEVEDTGEKLVKISVKPAILTSEKIHDIVPMDANAILILGQDVASVPGKTEVFPLAVV